jgi:dipeptidase
MCDTIVATANVTASGVTLFGKNSDRDPNEAQHLVFFPAANHSSGSRVKCTYMEIPQVERTHAVLLSKPFWMWGAEMGVNEHAVVIGNEAVFTKIPYQKQGNVLTGMDLLRLALERAATAREAVAVITGLLAEYEQGGNCKFVGELYYHNSYLIADPHDAWVLETAGPHWAAKQVSGIYTISNGLTIGNQWDLASPNLITHAIEQGWCQSAADFDFARCYSNPLYTRFNDCRHRCGRTQFALQAQLGKITANTLMSALRDHGADERSPDKSLMGANVCMHASFGPIRISQTTGSMVAHLHPGHPAYFFTGTAAPCTGIFKPVWFDTPLPDMGPEPTGVFHAGTLFWQHELLHRTTLQNYPVYIQLYREDRDTLEREFVDEALQLAGQPAAERANLTMRCFTKAAAAEARWLERLQHAGQRQREGWFHRTAWNKFNRDAEIPL